MHPGIITGPNHKYSSLNTNTMKLKILSLLLAVFLIGCNSKKNEIVINGKNIGESIKTIEYTIPVNKIFNGLMTDSIKPDTSGKFRIVIPFEDPGFIIVRPLYSTYPFYKTQGIIVAEPGNTYDITFDATRDSDVFYVSGYNEEALNLYNRLPNPIILNELEGTRPYMKDSVASSIRNKTISQKEKEIAIFKKLFDEGKISESFFKLVQTDRDCYYSAITAMIIENKYSISSRNANVKFTKEQRELYKYTDEMKELWQESFRKSDLLQEDLAKSPWWYSYSQRLTFFKLYTNNDISPLGWGELSKKNLAKTFVIDNGAKKYLPTGLIESYFANDIYRNCFLFREYQDYELITLYDQFVSEYPNSVYTRYLTPWINQYRDYQKKVSGTGISEKIKYIDNYQEINNLKDCLSSFKDKKVYVDMWATWCGPCRLEFAKAEKLREVLSSNNIEILYISIDEDRNEKNWKDIIKYFDLEGYHIRANSTLCKDLMKIQNSENGLYVPWHIMFDEKGNKITIPSEIADL
jgi:thiol-disulfide isomerase/thioredoxin